MHSIIASVFVSIQMWPFQIEALLCGSGDIGDLSELRVRTHYRGDFTDEHIIIQWFWVSANMSMELMKRE